MCEIRAIYRIYLILPPGGIVGEKPPTVGELGIYDDLLFQKKANAKPLRKPLQFA